MIYFITHPDVVVDPAKPVPEWPLSARGRERMQASLRLPWVPGIRSIHASTEQKAVDGAQILAEHLGLPFGRVEALGENDRSATGFLPGPEFEATADQFFARPTESVRGWETAEHAQQRIVTAVDGILRARGPKGDTAIVSHGAVGTLLLCHLAGWAIDRAHDQPGTGGGNYFAFGEDRAVAHGWRAIDAPEAR
ncbi:MAG: histidine phosphatase family protein [Myxococcota bacterium]